MTISLFDGEQILNAYTKEKLEDGRAEGFAEASSLSRPKPITKAYCFHLPEELAICAACPQCDRLIPRDFDERCAACGQALSWEDFDLDKLELVELL